jgi:hypothetical protein
LYHASRATTGPQLAGWLQLTVYAFSGDMFYGTVPNYLHCYVIYPHQDGEEELSHYPHRSNLG